MPNGNSFTTELAEWGPTVIAGRAVPTCAEASRYCAALAKSHYENFTVVSSLLPTALKPHFAHIYAYCRWADDLGDEVGDRQHSRELLKWWRGELHDCYAGRVRHPVFVALQETIAEFAIPITPFENLLSAFEQDQDVTEYATFNQLHDYCRRSADPVGRLVLYLCGSHRDEFLEWSDSICTGLQLANFWQDVARDAAMGRIYLPAEDRLRFGYSREEFDQKLQSPEFLALMKFEVDRARQFLNAGLPLIDCLPGRFSIAIDLFAQGGLCILRKIEAINYRVWDQRPRVTNWDAARLFLGAGLRFLMRSVRVSATRESASRSAIHE